MGKTSLTFYGGVDEIGGNKILLQDGSTRVLLDFGMSFSLKKQFYSPPFLSPKSEKSLQELGILPELKGVYRFDQNEPEISAIFLSHAHLDHSAYISFVKRDIPIYCGETCKTILQSMSATRRTTLEFDVGDLNFNTFRHNDKISVGSLEVKVLHVDHSIPGAYGMVIDTSNGAVVYTGDFRDHGAKPYMTHDFVKSAREAEPVALITEATNMVGASVSNESEVENKLNRIVSQAQGIILAEFGHSDVDRLNSLYRVAEKNDRCIAVSMKQAHLMNALNKDRKLKIPCLDDDRVLVFRKNKKRSEKWEKELMEKCENKNKVCDCDSISKKQSKIILATSFYDFEELISLKPEPGSCYVLSASEPFNEEMEIDFSKLLNWLNHYGLPQYHIHVSGHMMPLRLKSAIRTIDPRRVFPIHTENAELFCRFTRDLESKTIVVHKDIQYQI